MNTFKKTYLEINFSRSIMKDLAKNLLSRNKLSNINLNKTSFKSFARSTGASKVELEKKWKDHLEGFKQNWQKVKDDNHEQ